MKNTYPRSLAGLYEIKFDERVLKPVRIVDTRPTDYALREIRFNKNETGDAEFENGVCFTFRVKWHADNSYSFYYNEAPHFFDTKTDLGEVLRYVDVMSLTDIDPDDL